MDESRIPVNHYTSQSEQTREFAELLRTTLNTPLTETSLWKIHGLFSRFRFWPDALSQVITVAFMECAEVKNANQVLTEDMVIKIVDRVRKGLVNEAKRVRHGDFVNIAAAKPQLTEVEDQYHEVLDSLREFIKTLEPPDSLLFALRFVEDAPKKKSLKEIAEITGLPISTVSRRLEKAKDEFISRWRQKEASHFPEG